MTNRKCPKCNKVVLKLITTGLTDSLKKRFKYGLCRRCKRSELAKLKELLE